MVTGHAHHWGIGKSPSGMFTIVESGGLFEPKFMRYLQYKPGKNRAAVQRVSSSSTTAHHTWWTAPEGSTLG